MKKIEVAIIGAGPSGFSVAEVLRSPNYRPYFNFTIYEKNDYVGGKCLTVFENGEVCNGASGGYEIGAGIITKQAPIYKELNKILNKYKIDSTNYSEKDRKTLNYFDGGNIIELKQLHIKELFYRPAEFIKVFGGFLKYYSDSVAFYLYEKGLKKNIDYLYLPASERYSSNVIKRLSPFVQGFGYADFNNPQLTPPAIYYHQYFHPTMAVFPIQKFDNGMQGIWAKIANTYNRNQIKLNQKVIKISRSKNHVEVITKETRKKFDYLVVATPFKPTLDFIDYTKYEKQHIKKIKYTHMATVFCEVKNTSSISQINVPACMENENIGDVILVSKRFSSSDRAIVTVYVNDNSSDKKIIDRVEKSLINSMRATLVNKQDAKVYHWDDYFAHLDQTDLKNGWITDFNTKIQGNKRTIFVSTGLHMETVGSAVQFGTYETKKYAKIWLKERLASF